MKYLLSLLLIVFLYGCSSQAGNGAVKTIGKQVQKCCASFSVDKTAYKRVNTVCPERGNSSNTAMPISVFEITGKLATW
jgi:PBP1b-binding outer membrane lipoprotein LpoB